jgi:uncharacterized protein (DUF305 family)
MNASTLRGPAALLLAVLVLPACVTSSGAQSAPSPAPPTTTAAPAVPSGVAKARADSARYPYTEADVHFMSAMIPHHAQAIVMAGLVPTHGASASVRTLADRIIGAQHDEIRTMQTWLRDRGQPVPEAKPGPMKMKMNGMEHEMLMPGMLTDDQMKQLDQARGPQFDRLFLQYMIQHHRGAVSMVQELFGSYGAAQDETVFKFANDVNVDQSTEIERMQRMLFALTTGSTTP